MTRFTVNWEKIKEFEGTKRQMLTAVRYLRSSKVGQQIWLFSCECGGTKEMQKGNFLASKTNNCGCRHGKTKHGMALTGRQEYAHRRPIYQAWVNMRQRVNNPNQPDYKYYGARGIKHCERWNKFENFLEDMGASYEEHKKNNTSTTLDRKDVNGDYSPENCRWATRLEQSRNRRPWVQNGKLTHI